MKRLIISYLSITIANFIFISAAQAEARWPNWYVGLHGSMIFVDEVNVMANPTTNSFTVDTGVGFGAALGYRPSADGGNWRNLRMEIEWHQMRSDVNKIKAFSGAVKGDGQVRVDAVMANLFFDATFRDPGLKSTVTPYFGGGVGFATIKLDDTGNDLGNIVEKDNVLAFQLMAGLNYEPELIPFTEWSIGYRYFNATDASFAYNSSSNMEIDYDSHSVEAGVKFLF